jgi:metal-responsive CopG/Arc/MetJ family transcriptional regulator
MLWKKLWYLVPAMSAQNATVVRVLLPETLAASMDALSRQRCESRATLIREACAAYVAAAAHAVWEAEADRQYIASYTVHPETDEEEDWSAEYEAFLKEAREAEEFWKALPCSG